MQRSSANAELFGSGAHVTIRRGKGLVINFFSVCAQHRQRTNQTLEQTQGCLPD
jgi:hypothetical protein